MSALFCFPSVASVNVALQLVGWGGGASRPCFSFSVLFDSVNLKWHGFELHHQKVTRGMRIVTRNLALRYLFEFGFMLTAVFHMLPFILSKLLLSINDYWFFIPYAYPYNAILDQIAYAAEIFFFFTGRCLFFWREMEWSVASKQDLDDILVKLDIRTWLAYRDACTSLKALLTQTQQKVWWFPFDFIFHSCFFWPFLSFFWTFPSIFGPIWEASFSQDGAEVCFFWPYPHL